MHTKPKVTGGLVKKQLKREGEEDDPEIQALLGAVSAEDATAAATVGSPSADPDVEMMEKQGSQEKQNSDIFFKIEKDFLLVGGH